MSTRKFPLAGLPLTGEELLKAARAKVAGLSNEQATALLEEVDAEKTAADASSEADSVESIPTDPADQEAFGVCVYQGTKEASRRFNELTSGKDALSFEDAMEKMASEIESFDADTAALRDELNADPDQDLLTDMVAKVAQEDPAALAEFAAKKLAELGYEVKEADDGDDVEDEDEEEDGEGAAAE